ncbi:hypothetical protein O0L34_g1586 [Tuta absoluta]|nr:hypothetical protein O0L34_g1586 [Tuta absoluta]
MPKQSVEERLEKKRIAERIRLAKIKSDPLRYEALKNRKKEWYNTQKAKGKIKSVSEMNISQRNKKRHQERIQKRVTRKKQKERAELALHEDVVEWEGPNSDNDPLASDPDMSLDREGTRPLTSSPSPEDLSLLPKSPCREDILTLPARPIIENTPPLPASPVREDTPPLPTTPVREHSPLFPASFVRDTSVSTPPQNFADTKSLSFKKRERDNQGRFTRSKKTNRIDSIVAGPSNLRMKQPEEDRMSTISSESSGSSLRSSCESTPESSPVSSKKDKTQLKRSFKRKRCQKRIIFDKRAKDFKILHKRIEELRNLNIKYRKQLSRMKTHMFTLSSSDTDTSNQTDERDTIDETYLDEKKALEDTVKGFYLDDENSRMCAGKKECITRNKVKKQRRLMTDSMKHLHEKFTKEYPHYKISYSHFCKLRPFWVLTPKINDRETCLCKLHDNIELLIACLRQNKIISENSATEVLKSICCDPKSVNCLERKCLACKDKYLSYTISNEEQTFNYWEWAKTKYEYTKRGQVKTSFKTVKTKKTAPTKEIINKLEEQLKPFMKHCMRIITQYRIMKQLKENLKEDEAIVHCDFSENYGTKCNREIQASHFARDQITLHTVVIYLKINGQLEAIPFCTLSGCLRHDAAAIWHHLEPVLRHIKENAPSVTKLHFLSDAPSAQYRNKKMFYIISKLYWTMPELTFITWNYSESGHGKGAPDGVGGVLKRTADQIVARGQDIQDLDSLMTQLRKNVGVTIERVEESGILEKEMLIPTSLPKFTGTMQIHQVVWERNRKDVLAMRRLGCLSDECATSSTECKHGLHKSYYNLNMPNEGQNTEATKNTSRKNMKLSKDQTDKSAIKETQKKIKKPSKVKILSNQIIKPAKEKNFKDISVAKTSKVELKTISNQAIKPANKEGGGATVSESKTSKVEVKTISNHTIKPANKEGGDISVASTSKVELPLDDTFWQSVPSIDSDCLSTSVKDILFSALDDKNPTQMNMSFDDDENIF